MKYLLLFLLPVLIFSENIAVDYNFFDAGKGIYELVCNFDVPSNLITYNNIEGKQTGKLNFDFIIKNLRTEKIAKDSWATTSFISKNEKINRKMSLLDKSTFLLSPGNYEFTTIITDIYSNNKYTKIDTINLNKIKTAPYISSLMFGISAKPDTSNNKFIRNGISFIPNPSRVTTNLNPLLYVYCELYNFPINQIYSTKYCILQDKDTIQIINGKTDSVISNALINIVAINTFTLKDGEYTLSICVSIGDTFYVQKKNFIKSSDITYSPLQKYNLTDEELKYFDKIDYIATNKEFNQYKSLDEKGKYNFLIKFWESKDFDKSNNKLEALDEYIEDIKFVNKKFSSGGQIGYKSDRGKIFLKYGAPDEEMIVPSSTYYRSYENWIYYSNGGMQFIFTDIKGFGKFELVYASEMEEDIPNNWESFVDLSIIRFKRD